MAATPDQKADSKQQSGYNLALWRLVNMATVGCLLIVIYGLSFTRASGANFASSLSVGLMAAMAAMVSGGLLGFLFGVPHTREGESSRSDKEGREGATNSDVETGAVDPPSSYRPNTSLEQISDWLTKMLVGVGLIEIKVIPEKLKAIANYVAKGLGNNDQAQAFALALLIFFAVCGFVFGFLWARLFLKKWFTEADQVRKLGEKVDQLEERLSSDAKAYALVTNELNRRQDDQAAGQEQIDKAIAAASSALKTQIFDLAEEASSNRDVDDHETKNQSAISIFRSLIASDQRGRNHQYYSELAYALHRQELPSFEEAEKMISRAIEIRDKLGKSGWKYYEFCRARYRIEQDQNYKQGKPTLSPALELILGDLKAAYGERDRWPKWYRPDSAVGKWLKLNNIQTAALGA